MAIQRAEDKTAQMQARAGAIDELLASGALDDPTGTAKDDITLELEQLASTSDVENELRADEGLDRRRAVGCRRRPSRASRRGQPAAPAGSQTASPGRGQYRAPPGTRRLQPADPADPGRPAMIVRILSEGQWEMPTRPAPS